MNDPSPVVTVIIPTFNSSGTLRLALESVLLQDFRDFEVWVIGDGCTDDSEEVVRSIVDQRIHWANLPHNSGAPSAPRNEGLRRGCGSLIAYLGHDDLWFPWHLSRLVSGPDWGNVQFAYSRGALLAPGGQVDWFSLPKKLPSEEYISPSNWMHRKTLLDRIGLWPENLKFGDDRDFLQRVFSTGVQLDYREELTVLKYPAAAWRMYSLTSNYPQSSELDALRVNPEALRLTILLTMADQSGKKQNATQPHLIPMPGLVRRAIRRLLNWYGHQRWPVRSFEHWRWRQLTGLTQKRKLVAKNHKAAPGRRSRYPKI